MALLKQFYFTDITDHQFEIYIVAHKHSHSSMLDIYNEVGLPIFLVEGIQMNQDFMIITMVITVKYEVTIYIYDYHIHHCSCLKS